MSRFITIGRSWVRSSLCIALLTLAFSNNSWSQTTPDVRLIEFLPARQSQEDVPGALGAVTRYEVEVSVAGTAQVLERVNIGRPPSQPDGMIRADFAQALTMVGALGVRYTAKVSAIGPRGASVSLGSNPFTFNACQYRLTSTFTSVPAAGGDGSIEVSVNGGLCPWNPTSSAPWLQLSSAAGGRGNGRIAYTALRNPSAGPRSAALTVGSATYFITQAGTTPKVVLVSNEVDLQAATIALASDTTILIAPGTYRLTKTLSIDGSLTGVVIRGSTGRATDVVLEGAGGAREGHAPTGIHVTGDVQGLQIADLTIRRFAQHAILFEADARAPQLSNLRLVDSGDALIKVNAGPSGVDYGVVEDSELEYTNGGASASAGGIDIHGGRGWSVRRNSFRNIRTLSGQFARPAVTASAGSIDTLVEQNLFFNCQLGISLGLTNLVGGLDHSGGRVTNNFIYRDPSMAGGPGISVVDSPGTTIAHNTVITSGTYASPIEYRYPNTSNLIITNNLLDGAILGRDNAWAIESGNVTTATALMFVGAAVGDLHLRPAAMLAVNSREASTSESSDIDGDRRPTDVDTAAGADEIVPGNAYPSVQLVQSDSGVSVTVGSDVPLAAAAKDQDGTIAFVDFYANSSLVERLTQAPYTFGWQPTEPGSYSIIAIAVDNGGGRTASAALEVKVSPAVGR